MQPKSNHNKFQKTQLGLMASEEIYQSVFPIIDGLRNGDVDMIRSFVISLPYRYKDWWLAVYRESPTHVVVETALVVFVLWLLFIRRTVDPVKTSDVDRFTDKEVAWLVETWTPEPLVPEELSERDQRRSYGSHMVIVIISCSYLYFIIFPLY